jgi:hypothetical protein
MKNYYLIQKCALRAWGINPWRPHEIFTDKKEAADRCTELNKKAQHYMYEVIKVLNGEFKEHFYEDKS